MTARQKLLDPASPAATDSDGPRDQPAPGQNVTIVQLDYPLRRGDHDFSAISLRKPNIRDMRGLKVTNLMQMDVDTMSVLLPRISNPNLTPSDIDRLDPADIAQLSVEISSFFLAKRFLEEEGP